MQVPNPQEDAGQVRKSPARLWMGWAASRSRNPQERVWFWDAALCQLQRWLQARGCPKAWDLRGHKRAQCPPREAQRGRHEALKPELLSSWITLEKKLLPSFPLLSNSVSVKVVRSLLREARHAQNRRMQEILLAAELYSVCRSEVSWWICRRRQDFRRGAQQTRASTDMIASVSWNWGSALLPIWLPVLHWYACLKLETALRSSVVRLWDFGWVFFTVVESRCGAEYSSFVRKDNPSVCTAHLLSVPEATKCLLTFWLVFSAGGPDKNLLCHSKICWGPGPICSKHPGMFSLDKKTLACYLPNTS